MGSVCPTCAVMHCGAFPPSAAWPWPGAAARPGAIPLIGNAITLIVNAITLIVNAMTSIGNVITLNGNDRVGWGGGHHLTRVNVIGEWNV